MKTRIGLAMIVMLSMALGHINAKRENLMRSLVKRAPPPQRKAAKEEKSREPDGKAGRRLSGPSKND